MVPIDDDGGQRATGSSVGSALPSPKYVFVIAASVSWALVPLPWRSGRLYPHVPGRTSFLGLAQLGGEPGLGLVDALEGLDGLVLELGHALDGDGMEDLGGDQMRLGDQRLGIEPAVEFICECERLIGPALVVPGIDQQAEWPAIEAFDEGLDPGHPGEAPFPVERAAELARDHLTHNLCAVQPMTLITRHMNPMTTRPMNGADLACWGEWIQGGLSGPLSNPLSRYQ